MNDRELLLRALKRAGLTPESYNGRFMYGRECISVRCNHLSEVPAKHRKTANTDQMGLGIVVYWTWADWSNE